MSSLHRRCRERKGIFICWSQGQRLSHLAVTNSVFRRANPFRFSALPTLLKGGVCLFFLERVGERDAEFDGDDALEF
jgi:hypothetical protein